jgi:hypothetical protein
MENVYVVLPRPEENELLQIQPQSFLQKCLNYKKKSFMKLDPKQIYLKCIKTRIRLFKKGKTQWSKSRKINKKYLVKKNSFP